MFGQLFAGVGLGLLVGVLVGLSSSPVVSVVVGALAAGMVTLLGFARSSKDGDSSYAEGSVIRLGGFGVACAAAVLLGLAIRTHNLLSPSIAKQVSEVQKAGYSGEEARRWVAYKNIGAILESGSSTGSNNPSPPARGTESVAGSVLFSGADSGECQHFDTSRYKDASEHLYSLRQLGGKYAEYAEKISTLDTAQQKSVLESLRVLFCPK
jgi:hypothetical protein